MAKAKDLLTAKISVPFYTITSPTFEKSEFEGRVKDPKIQVPPSISVDDMDIYSREAELGGMTVKRSGWGTIEIWEGREKAVFHEKGGEYVLEGVYSDFNPYEMPLTKIIEQNAVKDIEAAMDYTFLSHVEAAIRAKENE
jgi:hypothetical protein